MRFFLSAEKILFYRREKEELQEELTRRKIELRKIVRIFRHENFISALSLKPDFLDPVKDLHKMKFQTIAM